jgi:hypothetical protein
MVQAFPAFCGIPRSLYAFNDLLHMVFDIVLDDIDLDDVLPQVIVLDVCYLSILISFLHQITQMVSFHLFNYLDQTVVKSRCEVCLLTVVLV